MLQWLTRTALCLITASALAAAPAKTGTLLPAGQDHVTLAGQITKGYLFLSGKIRGQTGVLMLDTGTPFPLLLNNHAIPLELNHYLSTGSAASGQQIVVYRHDDVGPVAIAGLAEQNFGPLNSADLGFINAEGGIRPDFLGFAGLPLLQEHEFILDYQTGTVEIYRTAENGSPLIPHTVPADIVAVIDFKYSGSGLPKTTFHIGDIQLEASFDSGSPGVLTLTKPTQQALERSGKLQKHGQNYTLDGLTYQGIALTTATPSLVSGAKDSINLGYNLLRHYRSVWNFKQQTLVLLKPK